MSKVSRSIYQKVAEENKRLKRDIETLVMGAGKERHECELKWRQYFLKIRNMNSLLRELMGLNRH